MHLPRSWTTLPLAILTTALAATALPAQIISPSTFATTPGGRFDNVPFGEFPQHIYQQVHGDLRGQAINIRELAFRNGIATVQSTARTVDAELEMGVSDFGSTNGVFDLNYIGAPTVVFNRKTLNLPDWTRNPSGGYPGPFDAPIAFDRPFPFPGTFDLTWKLTVFDNSTRSGQVANSYITDGFRFQATTANSGIKRGMGCMPTGRFVETLGTLTIFADWLPTPTFRVVPGFNYGPRNTQALVWLAPNDPGLPVPGLCTTLQVGGPLIEISGNTGSQTGAFLGPEFSVPYDAAFVGVSLHTQGAAFDPGRQGLPYTLSSGRESQFPALPPPLERVSSVFAKASATATTGTLANYQGKVVRLR